MNGRSMIRVRSPESYLAELPDIFKAILSQEDSVYTCPDYLSDEFQQKQRDNITMNSNLYCPSGMSTSTASSCSGINEMWREKISEWCYQVVDHFDYNRQVVSIAMNYLDRYLALRPVNRKIFQLAAMTCLFLAIKLNETRPLSLPAFLSLSRGYFQAEHVLKMEHAILRALQWRMNPPIALVQAKHLMFVLPRHVQRKSEILEITRFLTEITVCDYFFVSKKLSTVALAALYSAFDIIGTSCISEADKNYFKCEVRRLTTLESVTDDVLACVARMKHSFQQSGFTLSTFDSQKGRSEDGGNTSPVCVADANALNGSD